MNIDLLRQYKLQNPIKYAQKFGNKSPEEISLPVAPEVIVTGGVKIEFNEKKEKEVEFKEPILPVELEDKPKKGRKTKDV